MIGFFVGEYRFLSNFYLASFEYKDVSYNTVEHAFQSLKTNDEEEEN